LAHAAHAVTHAKAPRMNECVTCYPLILGDYPMFDSMTKRPISSNAESLVIPNRDYVRKLPKRLVPPADWPGCYRKVANRCPATFKSAVSKPSKNVSNIGRSTAWARWRSP